MAETLDPSQIEPVGDVVADLGEAPFWDPSDPSVLPPASGPGSSGGPAGGTMLWVDIPGGRLHRTVCATGETASADLGSPLSVVLPTPGDRVLLARQHRVVAIGPDGPAQPDGTEQTVAGIDAPSTVRFNDAATDPRGRVWIGTMDIGERDDVGVLYRLDPGGVLTPVIFGVTVSNGLGWAPDGSKLYYADSPTLRVDVFDYDPETGEVSGRRVFADIGPGHGLPDGLTVDAEGGVWVALHGGGVLHRYRPDGRLDMVAPLPATQVTSCAFGGPDLADLYVTTASAPLSAAQRAEQPLAGRLLRLRPGPVGLPQPMAVIE